MKQKLTPDEELNLIGTPDEKLTQDERILKHLMMFPRRGLTPLEAWQSMGVYRLSAAIFKLRAVGYNILTNDETVYNKYEEECVVASYTMPDYVKDAQ